MCVHVFVGSHPCFWLISLMLAQFLRWNWGQFVLTGSLESQSSWGYIPPSSIANTSYTMYTFLINPQRQLYIFTHVLKISQSVHWVQIKPGLGPRAPAVPLAIFWVSHTLQPLQGRAWPACTHAPHTHTHTHTLAETYFQLAI